MMNLLTGINGQLPVQQKKSAVEGRLSAQKERQMISDQLSAENKEGDNEELRNIAKEMESLFAYQLLKTMRESTDNMSEEKKGNGNSTYMSLFDMEISKLFGERGLGLQDAIIRSLERAQSVNNSDDSKGVNIVNNID